MAREIRTEILCDFCLEAGDREEGIETPPIIIGSGKPRVLALCEGHQHHFDEFAEMVRNLGQPAGEGPAKVRQAAAATAGAQTCEVCGGIYRNRKSLNQHMRSQHPNEAGISLAPAPPAGPDEATCPECDKVYKRPENSRPRQALAIHLSRAHGITAADRRAAAAS